MSRSIVQWVVVMLAAALAGCAGGGSTPQLPVGKSQTAALTPAPIRRIEARPGLIVLSDQLQAECRLAGAGPQSRNAFNDGLLRVPGMLMLDGVAECLLAGPLRGRRVSLTAYADDRHDGKYNQQLGVLRASTVQDYLSWRGVPKSELMLLAKTRAPAGDSERLASRHVELREAE